MSVTLPLGEWAPDLPALNPQSITVAQNVVPKTPLSYGPLPDLMPYSGNRSINPIPPLPAEPFGLYSFLDRNSNEHIFTGTTTTLYQFRTGYSQFKNVSNVIYHYAINTVSVNAGGNGYTAGDIVTLTWPTQFTTAEIQIDTVGPALYHAIGGTINAGGTGYTANDVLTIAGGTFTTAAQITVLTVDGGGVILTAQVTTDGDYSVEPSNHVSVTGGTGTGALFDLTWQTDPTSQEVLTCHLYRAGDYTEQPNSPAAVTGGTGTLATFNITTVELSATPQTYTATSYNPWQMVGFGNAVVATNGDDPPQVMNIDTDDQFTDLNRNKAPFGKYVCVCRNFLVLANITEPFDGVEYRQRVHWSAIGNASNWPVLGSREAAQLQSDAQDLRSDLGHIRGIASNLQAADMMVLMDLGVYTVRYVGTPAIFDFQIAQGAVGSNVPRSLIVNRGYAYYLGSDGFYAFDGTSPTPIGANKVDKWFFNDPQDGVDPNYLYLTEGSADPTGRLIMWIYCGPDSNGLQNRILIYNWQLNRWSMARLDVRWLGRGLSTGYSLDQLDQFGNMETLTPSLDDPYWQGGTPYLLAFDHNNQVCAFNGPNLAATITTQEGQPNEGHRSRITSARPLVDGGTPSVAVGSRNRLEDAVSYAAAVPMNAWGTTPQRVDARYFRGQLSIAAGEVWNHCQGVEVDFAASTYR